MATKPGETLLHYRLIEKIGEGGMGVVWKAQDTRLHRHVALKFLPEEAAKNPKLVERHVREARAASAMNHPHICSIYDIGEWKERQFIVMELLEGRNLQSYSREGPMDIEVATDLAIQIADALNAAHSKGIIHRDIKPANIMVAGRNQAKILDFGLAKLAVGHEHEIAEDGATLTALDETRPGEVMGTMSYMSPEQALGKKLDSRTDIFSLGVVIYEMITGRRAFQGDTSAAVFDAILNRAPVAPVQLNRDVPVELERIINKSLEKDPSLRYQSAADLTADLQRLRRDQTAARQAKPTSIRPASRRGLLMILGGIAVFAIAVGIWQPWRGGAEDTGAPATGTGSMVSGLKIAVLPFSDASGDPEQRYFNEGLTGEIMTELSRYGELAVMPCRSGPCEGEDVDIREIGREIGVRYVLQGRVQSSPDRIRVNVQLYDALDGHSVWSNRFESERTASDLFDLQDRLTLQVVNEIAGSYGALTRAALPGSRRKPPEDLGSHDCVFRAYDYLQNSHTAETHLAARECLERVVEAEPDYVDGLAWLAYLYSEQFHHRWNEPKGEYDSRERALRMGERAVSLDGSSQLAHAYLGLAALFFGDTERGITEMHRAAELNPHNPIVMGLLAHYLANQGDFEQALPLARRSIELNPHPPQWADFPMFLEHYVHERYEEALVHCKEGLMGDEDFREPFFLAATLGQLGRMEEAAPVLEDLHARWVELCERADCGDLTVGRLRQEMIERNAFSESITDKLIEGLAKAGLKDASE